MKGVYQNRIEGEHFSSYEQAMLKRDVASHNHTKCSKWKRINKTWSNADDDAYHQ